jgi:hypothetical protein
MQEEPRDWLCLSGHSIWPDRVIYNVDGEKVEAIFIIDKGNNRQLSQERYALVRVMEATGVNVKLAMGGQLFTLDEFNNGEAIRAKGVYYSRQQYYNARAEAKQLEATLAKLDPNSIAYTAALNKLIARKRLLDQIPEPPSKKPTVPVFGEHAPINELHGAAINRMSREKAELGWPPERIASFIVTYTKLKEQGLNRLAAERQANANEELANLERLAKEESTNAVAEGGRTPTENGGVS